MSASEANTLWARAFIDELAGAGVRWACVAPGSRSTPLVLAVAAHGAIRVVVHHDERCAAFFALGVGKASGIPAAVITTSGTAAANLYPAVVEASMAEVPLLLLTADRPHRLRGADANQTVDQNRLFGPFVRSFQEMAPPVEDPRGVRHARVQAARAMADALGDPAGPVHLNFPFDKPLEPSRPGGRVEVPEGGDGRSVSRIGPRRSRCDDDTLERLCRKIEGAERGVLVAGPSSRPSELGPASVRLAAAAGLPLLADPLSGARFGPAHGATVIPAYDLLLASDGARKALAPDLVLRVGQAPTSAALAAWLEEHRQAHQIVVDAGHRWKDHAVTAAEYVRADAAHTLDGLAARVGRGGAAEWRVLWSDLGEIAARIGAEVLEGDLTEGAVVAGVARAMPAGGTLVISSSLPIRDLDAFAEPRQDALLALGNRGASGIDGVVSTGLGVAAGREGPTVVLLGDVAFHHDLTGLFATREAGPPVVFVVIHNDGGGIFHALPIREHEPHFTPYFVTPHGLDFSHAAALYGLPFVEVDSVNGLRDALGRGLAGQGSTVVQVRTDAAASRTRRDAVTGAVTGAVLARLKEEELS